MIVKCPCGTEIRGSDEDVEQHRRNCPKARHFSLIFAINRSMARTYAHQS